MNTLNYYQENYGKIFDAVENPQWRLWKTVDKDGEVRPNRRNITSKEKLLDFIKLSKNPQCLYVSVSEFLNPKDNRGFMAEQLKYYGDRYSYKNGGYVIDSNIMLSSYFYVDCDCEHDLRIAQDDCLKIIEQLQNEKSLTLKSIQYSGNKGLNLIYKHKLTPITDPIMRIKDAAYSKSTIVKQLAKLKLRTIDVLHNQIMQDVFRVYAAPYSIKGKTGNTVTPIPASEFTSKDIYTILKNYNVKVREAKPSYSIFLPGKSSPGLADDGESINSAVLVKRANLSSSTVFFYYLDNVVHSLKNNYVTVLKFKNKRYNPKTIQHVQAKYKLTDFHVVKIGKYTYAYNTKLVQRRRLVKILKESKSENLDWFVKNYYIPIQITPTQDAMTKEITEQIEPLGVIPSAGSKYMHSKYHSKWLKEEYLRMTGDVCSAGILKVTTNQRECG